MNFENWLTQKGLTIGNLPQDQLDALRQQFIYLSAQSQGASGIATAAFGFKSMSGDEGSVTNHSVDDMIKADKYLRRRSKKHTSRGLLRRISGGSIAPPSGSGS